MKIIDILTKDAVIVDLASDSKSEALAEMASALAKAEPGLNARRLVDVLTAREALQSTGIGEGVAVPHGKMPGLDHPVVSFARSVAGIDWDAIDGQPINLVSLLVVPDGAGEQSLKALARISRFFRDAGFRENIRAAKQLEDIFKAIQDVDGKLG